MVSDFIDEHKGFLVLSDGEFEEETAQSSKELVKHLSTMRVVRDIGPVTSLSLYTICILL